MKISVKVDYACRVMAELEAPESPYWLSFRDILGAQYLVRADEIVIVRESTARIRARMRAFYRARKREVDEDESSCDD